MTGPEGDPHFFDNVEQFAQTMADRIAEYIELSEKKRTLEADLRSLKARIADAREPLLDEFSTHGLKRVADDDTGRTLYIHRAIRIKNMGDDRTAACEALRAAGLGHYVAEGFNLNSVSAYFREMLDELDSPVDPNSVLPDELKGVIELVADVDLRVTK